MIAVAVTLRLNSRDMIIRQGVAWRFSNDLRILIDFVFNLAEIAEGAPLSDLELYFEGTGSSFLTHLHPEESMDPIFLNTSDKNLVNLSSSLMYLVFQYVEVWAQYLPGGLPRSLLLPMVLKNMEEKEALSEQDVVNCSFCVCSLQILVIISRASKKFMVRPSVEDIRLDSISPPLLSLSAVHGICRYLQSTELSVFRQAINIFHSLLFSSTSMHVPAMKPVAVDGQKSIFTSPRKSFFTFHSPTVSQQILDRNEMYLQGTPISVGEKLVVHNIRGSSVVNQDPWIMRREEKKLAIAFYPYSSMHMDILHDGIYRRLCSVKKDCPSAVMALWGLQRKLLNLYGVNEIIKALPYILGLENNWMREDAEDKDQYELLGCQRVFLSVFFRSVAELIDSPTLTQLVTSLLESW